MYFVIGASGSGKTSVVRHLENARLPGLRTFFFDSIGVPSPQEMIVGWGSGENWQRTKTIEWVARIKPELETSIAILDGQTRPQFVSEACEIDRLTSYRIILIHCSDVIRRARLFERGQPELANDQMMQWAAYLLSETQKLGGVVIHNDELTVPQTASALQELLHVSEQGQLPHPRQ
jgi:dephospho-CoA kinase